MLCTVVSSRMRVVVRHTLFGGLEGCCGHVVVMADGRRRFEATHPWSSVDGYRAWAEDLVRDAFGEQHVRDLDWDGSLVLDHDSPAS